MPDSSFLNLADFSGMNSFYERGIYGQNVNAANIELHVPDTYSPNYMLFLEDASYSTYYPSETTENIGIHQNQTLAVMAGYNASYGDQIVSTGFTLVREGRRVFPNLTVEENLRIGAYLRKDSIKEDMEKVYELFPRLKEREWQLAGTLSGGEQQMLAVGRALMAKPKLVMMDEPSLGLAPLVVKGIFDIIKEINRQGITVLLIEQNANMALKTADWAYVMQTGTILMQGEGKELLENEEVKAAYLGKAK